MTTFALRNVKLRPGEEFVTALQVELPSFAYGGERYASVAPETEAKLVIDRTLSGTMYLLRLEARLHGPCYRCLGEALVDVPINAREYQDEKPDDPELETPYVNENELDVSGWARDAIALALPEKILCRPDCAGLCPQCGKNLNDEPHTHEEPQADSRWGALEALRDEL